MGIILGIAALVVAVIALLNAGRAGATAEDLKQRQLKAFGESLRGLLGRVDQLERRMESRPSAPAGPPGPVTEEKPAAVGVAPPAPAAPGVTPVAPAAAARPRVPPIPSLPRKEAGIPLGEVPPVPPARPLPEVRPAIPVTKPAPPVPPPIARPAWVDEARRAALESRRVAWEKFEEAVGKRWMTWAGVLVLFLAAGFFLKYAFDNKWIGPGTQILLAVLAGIVMAGLGIHFLRKGMRALGQGLVGGGLMVLYVALFCAYSPSVYANPPIESPKVVFGLMCVVTAAGIFLAILHDALPISFLAILGGFLTPVLVSTGVNQRDGLFAYVLLLDVGVLAAAFYKRWRALDVLAFVGTVALFVAWFHEFYLGHPEYAATALWPTTLWLGAFYVVFLSLAFVHYLHYATPITIERFVLAMANATFAFGYGWWMLKTEHTTVLACITLGMSAAYLALGVLTRRRIVGDAKSVFGFLALSVAFLTIAVPVYFKMNGITLSWTAEACALLFLGWQFRYRPVRVAAFLVLLLVVERVFAVHWPLANHGKAPFDLVLNRAFLILMCAPLGAAVSSIIHQVFRRAATSLDHALKTVCTIGAGLLFLLFLHVELEQWLVLRASAAGIDPDYLRLCGLAAMWGLGAAGFLTGGWRGRFSPVLSAGLLPLLVAIVFGTQLYFTPVFHDYWLALNGRFTAAALVCAVIYGYAFASHQREVKLAGLIVSGYVTLLLLHAEIFRWIGRLALSTKIDLAYERGWSLALLWTAGAAAYLAVGRLRRSQPTGWSGLAALLVGFVFAAALYVTPFRHDYRIVLNVRFLASLAACAVLAAYAWTARDRPVRVFGLILAGYATLTLLHVEIFQWIGRMSPSWGIDGVFLRRWVLAVLWALGAVAYLAAARRSKSNEARGAGLVPLVVAIFLVVALYVIRREESYGIFLNARFLASFVVLAAGAAYACAWEARDAKVLGLVSAGYAALLLLHVEIWRWLEHEARLLKADEGFVTTWVVAVLWTLGCAAFLLAGKTRRAREAYWAALLPLAVAFTCVVRAYFMEVPAAPAAFACELGVFVNARFLAGLLVAAASFALTWCLYSDRERLGESELALRRFLHWTSIALLLLLLSVEPYLWCIRTVTEPKRAHWLAQMSLSLVFGTYASVLLSVGFWRRDRSLRLTGLGLFGLTALKLVFVDLAHIQQIYRVVSFFVLGVLMVGSAYLYHKAESLLREMPGGSTEGESPKRP